MDIKEALEKTRAYYKEKQPTLSKDEVSFILGRDTLRGKLLGFMERRYYKRKKLVRDGEVVVGYAHKDFRPGGGNAETFPVWVFHSIDRKYEEDPSLFLQIPAKIEESRNIKEPGKELKRFLHVLDEPYADASFLEVPSEVGLDGLVYLSVVYLRADRLLDFRLGYNFFLGDPSISKEILFLPARYIPFDVYKVYAEEGFGS